MKAAVYYQPGGPEVFQYDEVRRITGGHGADVIVDPVGGQALRDALRCLAYRGRCVSVGDAGRQDGDQI